MRWERKDISTYMRWALYDVGFDDVVAVIDKNQDCRTSASGAEWEFMILDSTEYDGFTPFPEGKWTMEERQAFVVALWRMT